ncbi:MAG: chloramphenicol resistance protein [Clostridia bacterium]|nr:chloramphenicol resistance protein [Clostridia bacterium]
MIIKALRDFFSECPYLSDGYINVDYLPPAAVEYSIEPLPTDAVIRRYTDGATLKKYDFVFAARLQYTEELFRNIENNLLFENITQWLEEKCAAGELVKLDDGKFVQSIEVTSSGYCFSEDGNDTAAYQMQCRLVYYQI